MNLLIRNKFSPIYQEFNGNEFTVKSEFNEIYRIILPFFKNIRDLNRFINIFSFYLDSFKEEININDFLLITILQVFEYKTYLEIKNSKEFLLNYYSIQKNARETQNKIINEFFEDLCKKSEINNDALLSLLIYLFPIFNRIQIPNIEIMSESSYNKNLRISSSKHFDKYFTLSLEEDEIGHVFVKTLINNKNINEISEIITKINEEGKSFSLFEKLISETKDLDKEKSSNLIQSIFDVAENLNITNQNILPDSQYYIQHVLENLFNNLNDNDLSFNLIKNAINEAKSIYTLSRLIYDIESDWGIHGSKQRNENISYVSKDDALKLEILIYEKIKELANNKQLFNYNDLDLIIEYWEIWGNKEEIQEFLNLNVITNEDLIKLLSNFIKSKNFINLINKTSKIVFNFDFEKLKKHYELEQLFDKINEIIQLDIDDNTTTFCKCFLESAKKEQNG